MDLRDYWQRSPRLRMLGAGGRSGNAIVNGNLNLTRVCNDRQFESGPAMNMRRFTR